MKNFENLKAVLSVEARNVSSNTERVFHGRGHCFPPYDFLNIDLLGSVVLITLYQDWDQRHLNSLAEFLCDRYCTGNMTVVLQRRHLKPAQTEYLRGPQIKSLVVEEAGLRYKVQFDAGLHSGLFLDMAVARQWLRDRAAGRRVLNLFAHSCAFSVAALAGGAASVVNIDLNKGALSRGRENHRLNNQPLNRVKFLAYDIFKSWGKMGRLGPYDMVIIDPPSYQPGSFVVSKDYVRVLKRLPDLLSAEAQLLVCLNDPLSDSQYLQGLVAEINPKLVFQKRLDNPQAFKEMDGEQGLKVLHYTNESATV